jgi:hypothetical protein
MVTPLIRAKAKDITDELDNLTAYFEPTVRREVRDYVLYVLAEIEKVLADAGQNGTDQVVALRAFVTRVSEYLPEEIEA